jgi:hypothetical protein
MDETLALALAFDTNSSDFTRGVEVGRLWEQLKSDEPVVQEVHATNAEMLLRMAESTGRPLWAEDVSNTWLIAHFDAAQGTPDECSHPAPPADA